MFGTGRLGEWPTLKTSRLVPVSGACPRGGLAKVVLVEWFGDQAVKVTFEDATGAVKNRLVYRADTASGAA